jgi:hypothetical protein
MYYDKSLSWPYQRSEMMWEIAFPSLSKDASVDALKLSALDSTQARVQFSSHNATTIFGGVRRKDLQIPNSYPNYSPVPEMI